MVTYVNTVLVGTGKTGIADAISTANAGKFVVVSNDGTILNAQSAANAEAIKVGLITNETTVNMKDGSDMPIVKWSNIIKKANIKSYTVTPFATDTEDTYEVDFTGATINKDERYVLRLTFKDLPTRYRKWTESYEISAVETATALADAFAAKINKEFKRARVKATASAGKLTLEAMKYTDDNAIDTISPAEKVRFAVNAWKTNPTLAGFASKNKYSIDGIKIEKTIVGKTSMGSWKLVRDMESQAMGYQGILNRGDGTWPIIKPKMNVVENGQYDTITLEFENMYRAADDIQRHTKQTLQVYDITGKVAAESGALEAVLEAFVKGEHDEIALGTSDVEFAEA